MSIFGKVFSFWCLLVASLCAQVNVDSGTFYQITGVDDVYKIGEIYLNAEVPKLSYKQVGVIEVEKVPTFVEAKTKDGKSVNLTKVGAKTYLIDEPGQYVVELTFLEIDWEERTHSFSKETVEIVIGELKPEPDPNVEVPNKYKVGLVAYEKAPDSPDHLLKYSEVYKQAGEFLYGRPSLKFIAAPDHKRAKDPDYNVVVWIRDELSKNHCTGCDVMVNAINEAVLKSQKERGYFSKSDWYACFNEISQALALAAKGK